MLTKRLALAVVVVFAIGLGVSTVFRAGPHQVFGHDWGSKAHRTDFTVYSAAGRAVLDGTNVYDAHNVRGWYFMYLPVFAIAMVPFGWLNNFWGALIWYVLSALMIWHATSASVRLARREFPQSRMDPVWLGLLVFLLICVECISGLARGQASVLITYLAVMSLVGYFENRHWLAGFCLAGSIVIKIFPVLLLFYFAAKRRYAMAGITALWLIVLVFVLPSAVFGIGGNIELLRRWVTTIALPANRPDNADSNVRYGQMIDPDIFRNQSVQAVLIRIFTHGATGAEHSAQEKLARHVAAVLNACLALIAAWAIWRNRRLGRGGHELIECCVIMLLMLFLAPVSWSHNYSLLIAPLVVAFAAASAGRKWSPLWIGLLLFAILSLSARYRPLQAYGVLLWGSVAVWAGLIWWLTGSVCRAESCTSSRTDAGQVQASDGSSSAYNSTTSAPAPGE